MSAVGARWALGGYRWAGLALYPLLIPYLAVRAAKGKEEHPRRRERFGYAREQRPAGPLVWFHAASVGETVAVIPLIREVRNRGIGVILTTGTVTSAAVVAERLGDSVIHQYVPLDLKPAVGRFLDHWKPDLAIIAESEIWPMTILELGARRMPQVLVNGRLSDRSFESWSRRPSLAEALFENLSHVVAQSDVDAERFVKLGARPVSVSGNLKFDAVAPPHDEAVLAHYRAQTEGRAVWAAVSTFEGEEAIAMDVHQALKQRLPILTMIIPRHPDRCDAIEKMARKRGLSVARRSSNATITPDTDLLIGDTIGEMGLYLNLTEIAFVGRSLTKAGGQNPMEPAALHCAVLSGPNVKNFRDAYQQLLKNGGARMVRDGDTLTKAVGHLLFNEEVRHSMMAASFRTLDDMRGALSRTLAAIEPFLHPLVLKAGLAASEQDHFSGYG